MASLTHRERIGAALSHSKVDRVPYTIWTHYPRTDLEPAALARFLARDAMRCGFDLVKIANNGLYSVLDYGTTYAKDADGQPATDRYGTLRIARHGVVKSSQWASLPILDPDQGSLGDQLQILRRLKAEFAAAGEDNLPVIATLYSPLTTAYKLGGELLLRDMREHPAAIHSALRTLTDTTIRYARRCIELGGDGFFFASQLASFDYMDEATYAEFGQQYDLAVFESFSGRTFIDVVHIHGNNTMFNRLAAYPANCINWHDRWIGPSIAEARKRTSKCLLGGIDEENILGAVSDGALAQHVEEALEMAGDRGFILGPGCTASPGLSESQLRTIVDVLNRKRSAS